MTALVVRGNAERLPLRSNSVDLIVTSPPYFALRSYQDGGQHYAGQIGAEPTPQDYIAALIGCTREWMRVLKPSGSIFVNLGDKYSGAQAQNIGGVSRAGDAARTWQQTNPKNTGIPNKSLMLLPERYRIGCVDQLGLTARSVIVWDKPNGLPESVTDRVRRSHEDWVHLTKQPRYFAAMDEIREPHAEVSIKRAMPHRANPGRRGHEVYGATAAAQTLDRDQMNHPLGKLPGSVWRVATEPLTVPDGLGVDHFAAFPTAWPLRLICGWSEPGMTVLDPFGGTGTTALCASALGRTGISVDLSHDYSRLAQWRTTDPAQRAKAMRVEKPPVQLDGQIDMFGEVA